MSETPTVTVPWQRLETSVFSKQVGDIAKAMIGGLDAKKLTVKSFTHEGNLWTTIGGSYGLRSEFSCYRLIAPEAYTGTTEKVQYSYEGQLVTCNRQSFRLGPKTEFIASPRTVEEWQERFLCMYTDGGSFTAHKTYHEVLHDFSEKEHWNVPLQKYQSAAEFLPEYGAAIAQELTKPDWTKWTEPAIEPEPIENQTPLDLEQLALVFDL